MLVGLASFGVQCGSSVHFPGVFADVYYYRDWIKENSAGNKVLQSTFIFICGFSLSFVTFDFNSFS